MVKELMQYSLIIRGTNKQIEDAEKALSTVALSGVWEKDSITLQKLIDTYKLNANLYYKGSTIYPYEKMMKEFKKMIDKDDISDMTDMMYKFLSIHFDIAHYDKHNYIEYYDGRFSKLYKERLEHEFKHSMSYRVASTVRIVNGVLEYVNSKLNQLSVKKQGKKTVSQDTADIRLHVNEAKKSVSINETSTLTKTKKKISCCEGQTTLFDLIFA